MWVFGVLSHLERFDDTSGPRKKVFLLAGDGGLSGIPRHLEQLILACRYFVDFTVVTDADRGGYRFLSGLGVRHVEIVGLSSSYNPMVWFGAIRSLKKLVNSESPDLIWAHARMSIVFVRWLQILGVLSGESKVGITFHGLPFEPGQRYWLRLIGARLERVVAQELDGQVLFFLTGDSRDCYLKCVGEVGFAKSVSFVLNNCSDLGGRVYPIGGTPKRPRSRTLIMTGRDSWQKNLDRGFKIFSQMPHDYNLMVCGEGTDTISFKKRAGRILSSRALGRVQFLGAVLDVKPFLLRADCFLLTSRYEGVPIGALEAFEVGLPIAMTDIPGNREILCSHPYSAHLSVEKGWGNILEDAQKVLDLVEGWREEPSVLRRRIHQSWEEKYSFDVWSRDMVSILRRVLSET